MFWTLRKKRDEALVLHAQPYFTNFTHRWELTGNYRDFMVVMVFYLFCRRTNRILVTPIIEFKFFILIQ